LCFFTDCRFESTRNYEQLAYFTANRIFSIRGQHDSDQNPEDRYDNHQLDEAEAPLYLLHLFPPTKELVHDAGRVQEPLSRFGTRLFGNPLEAMPVGDNERALCNSL